MLVLIVSSAVLALIRPGAAADDAIPPKPASLNCNSFEAAYHPGVKQWYCVTTKPSARARAVARRQQQRRQGEVDQNNQAALQAQLQFILRRTQEVERLLRDVETRSKETLRPRRDLERQQDQLAREQKTEFERRQREQRRILEDQVREQQEFVRGLLAEQRQLVEEQRRLSAQLKQQQRSLSDSLRR